MFENNNGKIYQSQSNIRRIKDNVKLSTFPVFNFTMVWQINFFKPNLYEKVIMAK